jgi:hypothetical protein
MVVVLTVAGTLLSLAAIWFLYLNFNMWRITQSNIHILNECSEVLEALAQQQAQAIKLMGEESDEEDPNFGVNQG